MEKTFREQLTTTEIAKMREYSKNLKFKAVDKDEISATKPFDVDVRVIAKNETLAEILLADAKHYSETH